MPVGLLHHAEDLVDVGIRHRLVEEIAHAVDEDAAGLAPAEWEAQQIGLEGHREPSSVPRIAHRLETDGEPLCVTMLTAGADLGAPRHGVPGRIRPLDAGV